MRLLFVLFIFLAFAGTRTSNAQTLNTYSCTHGAGLVRQFQVDSAFQPICTMSWTYIGGPCDGNDMVSRWTQIIRVDGVTISDWRMRPWATQPVLIRSFTLSKISGGPHGNMMVGNSYVNDAMVTFGSAETSAFFGTPAATGVPFPGTSNDPGDAYFDLHGSCTGGGTASFRVDIGFTPTPDAVAPPPAPTCAATGTPTTLNPADKNAGITLSNGNLSATNNGSAGHELVRAIKAISANSGKYYWEWAWSGQGSGVGGPPINIVGVQDGTVSTATAVGNGGTGTGWGYDASAGYLYASNALPATAATAAPGNTTLGIAYDSATGKIWMRNASGWLSGDPVAGASPSETISGTVPTLYAAASLYGSSAGTVTFNFGASSFAYSVPSGYTAGLCN